MFTTTICFSNKLPSMFAFLLAASYGQYVFSSTEMSEFNCEINSPCSMVVQNIHSARVALSLLNEYRKHPQRDPKIEKDMLNNGVLSTLADSQEMLDILSKPMTEEIDKLNIQSENQPKLIKESLANLIPSIVAISSLNDEINKIGLESGSGFTPRELDYEKKLDNMKEMLDQQLEKTNSSNNKKTIGGNILDKQTLPNPVDSNKETIGGSILDKQTLSNPVDSNKKTIETITFEDQIKNNKTATENSSLDKGGLGNNKGTSSSPHSKSGKNEPTNSATQSSKLDSSSNKDEKPNEKKSPNKNKNSDKGKKKGIVKKSAEVLAAAEKLERNKNASEDSNGDEESAKINNMVAEMEQDLLGIATKMSKSTEKACKNSLGHSLGPISGVSEAACKSFSTLASEFESQIDPNEQGKKNDSDDTAEKLNNAIDFPFKAKDAVGAAKNVTKDAKDVSDKVKQGEKLPNALGGKAVEKVEDGIKGKAIDSATEKTVDTINKIGAGEPNTGAKKP